jgi:hypothetical protein
VLAECDGGADQQFLLRDFHFLVFGEKCFEGNGTWAGFATCDQDNPSQWFTLAAIGNSGPIANCWCEPGGECPISCGSASGVAFGSDSAYQGAYLVIDSEPLWLWTSSAASGTPPPSEEPSTSDESTSILSFSTAPAGAALDEPNQCLTESGGGLVLAECDGGADQQFLLRDFHFLVFGEKCLEGNGTWAGFATCDQGNPSQWFTLASHNSGPILNCWCEQWAECPMSCESASGVAHGSDSAYLVIDGEPLVFWTSSAASGTPPPSEEPSTSDEAQAPPEEPSTSIEAQAPPEEPSTSIEAQAPQEEPSTTKEDATAVPSSIDELAEELMDSQAEGGVGDALLHCFPLLVVMCAFIV